MIHGLGSWGREFHPRVNSSRAPRIAECPAMNVLNWSFPTESGAFILQRVLKPRSQKA